MSLFNRKKDTKPCCCQICSAADMETAEKNKISGARIKILGSGCAKCNQLEANTLEALLELGMETAIDHVTDFAQIAAYGVMTTPALVADGKVLSYGKVLSVREIVTLLKKVRE